MGIGYKNQKVPYKEKFYNFLQDIWPSIYKLINDFFYGLINFIKFLIRGLWPGK